MSTYTTDDEQVEQLKRIIKSYGWPVLLGVILALVISYGYRYWQTQQLLKKEKAAMLYTTMITAPKSDIKEASAAATALMQTNSSNSYAALALLWQAKQAIAQQDFTTASSRLNTVITQTKQPVFKQIARLRLARIQIQLQKPEAALITLKTIDDASYQGLIDETKGDAYVALHDTAQATTAYQQALHELPEDSDPLLSLKYINLGTTT